MDYSFLAASLFFTFVYTCIFFSWQINSAAALGIGSDATKTAKQDRVAYSAVAHNLKQILR